MKSFVWRLRSNAIWFLASIALFTVIYVCRAFFGVDSITFRPDFGDIICLRKIDPVIISALCALAFFMIYTKHYTYEEEYFYGRSRKYAFCASQCCAIVYSLMFSFYALGLALLVRRGVLNMYDVIIPTEIYDIAGIEVFCNFALLFVAHMLMFEFASTLRKFKSWKFWLTFLGYLVTMLVLLCVFVFAAMKNNNFEYWRAMFLSLVPQLVIMTLGDFFMTRGRQYR